MATIDLATGQPLPADAIQRVLFIAPLVHIYNIPPLTTTKGYTAATWTAEPQRHIFSARLRVVETATPTTTTTAGTESETEHVKTDILLEDPQTGDLFAAAPYTDRAVVEQVLDSSRFFAVRVVGDGGRRRAVLGIGFEQRPEAFDFGVTLQEVCKVLGFVSGSAAAAVAVGNQQGGGGGGGGGGPRSAHASSKLPSTTAPAKAAATMMSDAPNTNDAKKPDYSLKDGETIHVTIGSKGRRRPVQRKQSPDSGGTSTAIPFLPPPPSADDVRAAQQQQHQQHQLRQTSSVENDPPSDKTSSSSLLLPPPPPPKPPLPPAADHPSSSGFDDDWGDFQ